MKGKLIVFEGIDGAGKATQVKLLAKKLRARGNTVTVFSFPDYSGPIGKFIRNSLHGKHGNHRAVDTYYGSLPYAVDRGLARDKILAALKKGLVICDRYATSNLAFGAANCAPGERAGFRKFFEDLEYNQFKIPRPHYVIYLSISPSLTQKWLRKERRTNLDANERDVRYQKAVAAEYKKLAKRKEWHTVKCEVGDTPEAINRKVEDALR